MIADFCRIRVEPVLAPSDLVRLRSHLENLVAEESFPVYRGKWVDIDILSEATGIQVSALLAARPQMQPIFDAICRSLGDPAPGREKRSSRPRRAAARRDSMFERTDAHPDLVALEGTIPHGFADALRAELVRHGERVYALHRAVVRPGDKLNRRTIWDWCAGATIPGSLISLDVVDRIERHYQLPKGYLRSRIPTPARAARGHVLETVSPAERRRLAWHLPDDFGRRSEAEQEEILNWVRTVVISGSTDYRRYQAAAMRQRYAIRFRGLDGTRRRASNHRKSDAGHLVGVIDAPPRLQAEMTDLLRFKTSTLTAFGLRRNGVWGEETAEQKIEHLGLMLGSLAASPDGEVGGFGADVAALSLGMLVLPAVWDWYLMWREKRRGFYTAWEIDMLSIGLGLVRKDTGWLRQTPRLSSHLVPIPGLVSEADVLSASSDWDGACDEMHKHGRQRVQEIKRVARVHRDPFEPIMPVLEAKSPVGEYRKITDEILRLMPDERHQPRAAAEAVRSFLMLRFGLHLGLRQRNLRELLVCAPGKLPTSERHLEERRCGELRWCTRDGGWEVLIPSVAFKNANSSFFGSKPFRLILPDLGGLYDMIGSWIDRHRRRLLGPAEDPGTFFVKTAKLSSTSAAYDQNTFYEAWRSTIQRYGIRNPYTGRGAIEGLLPHGPHNVRDVLATHILKATGSYEQASYAIQDTPEMVAQHYGRFLPQDKAAIAARILNQVWETA